MSTAPNPHEHANDRLPSVLQPVPSGPVSAPAPRPRKLRPRGAPLTPERARAMALAREAAKRAARAAIADDLREERQTATLGAKAAKPGQVSDPAGLASDQAAGACARVADPIDLGSLVEGPDGCLTLPEPLKRPGATEPSPAPERAVGPRPTPPKPRLPGKPDLAQPRAARLPRPAPSPVEVPELEPVEQAPVLVIVPAPPDPAEEAQRIARARLSMARLYQAIAAPHLARWSLPWVPDVVETAGVCDGCSQRIAADRVAGHAVARAQAKRGRCVRWCFRIPEPS